MSPLVARHREWVKWKLRQFGPGRKHSLKLLTREIMASLKKWEHTDPNYGAKLAMAMVRIAALKRDANIGDDGQRLDGN